MIGTSYNDDKSRELSTDSFLSLSFFFVVVVVFVFR